MLLCSSLKHYGERPLLSDQANSSGIYLFSLSLSLTPVFFFSHPPLLHHLLARILCAHWIGFFPHLHYWLHHYQPHPLTHSMSCLVSVCLLAIPAYHRPPSDKSTHMPFNFIISPPLATYTQILSFPSSFLPSFHIFSTTCFQCLLISSMCVHRYGRVGRCVEESA